jgi:Uma2 family endonuclease
MLLSEAMFTALRPGRNVDFMSTTEQRVTGYSVESYFGLVRSGDLDPDDHVELLDGVIVAEPPQDPPHASAISRLTRAVGEAVGKAAVIRVQLPLIAGPFSVPEPDLAVVGGCESDYDTQHPTAALLVVEAAFSSLPQDRLSKQRIYAAAACPEYWIVNLRDECVEIYRAPDVGARVYRERLVAHRGDEIRLVSLPDASVRVADLLPARA